MRGTNPVGSLREQRHFRVDRNGRGRKGDFWGLSVSEGCERVKVVFIVVRVQQ